MSIFSFADKEGRGRAKPAAPERRARGKEDAQDLMVLEDMDNGNEYYLYQLDSFRLYGHTYVCMASYEPETGSHTEPQLVIMRKLDSGKDDNQQYFESIRDKKELDRVFSAFYTRMEENLNL